ncbi:glycosyltransferase [Microvirga sp. BSC39]|uniref:glycosyltransferase family 2 protein n=1 Tax=Microvirga sp. BSC39 TaxID=1549810 RepID=UPI0004E8EB1A|nr:glycosyltransferase [Microvirga sp. BSC39]KFG70229.1 hypothetical protein JH26_05705 [Microvirga sp. BSC39]
MLFSQGGVRQPLLSVVIGIRNWGLDRLEIAIRSHLQSSIHDIEIVISDYGSDNKQEIQAVAHKYKCKYIYTEAKIWSRSAALNLGIREASSENILTTDADIIFSPRAHEILLTHLAIMPNSVQIIQCRDLPEGFGADNLAHLDWEQLFQVSSIRPRWGMGGSATFTRALFSRLHGFEERMTVWGGEDTDFVQRARRSGSLFNWVEDPEARIYHIWHPPDSRGTSPAGTKIVQQNRQILQEDRTIVRNLGQSYRGASSFVPTVSIVITTKDRPTLLRESVASCLSQTFQDFELIVVDDGSSDYLKPALDEFADDRIRLLHLERSRGISFARNAANRIARGEFIALHDDSDLMLPHRLEHQLGAVIDDCAGSYGGWIDFDDETGALTPQPGRTTFDRPSLMFTRTLVPGSVLIRRQVLGFYRYNESFLANPDYHLFNRIARGGVRLCHCGHYVILRRSHSHHLTGTDSVTPGLTVAVSKAMDRGSISVELEQQYKTAAKATQEATIPFTELVDAAQHLPPRLTAKRARIELDAPLTARSGQFQALGTILSASHCLHLEFATGPAKGIKAVTIPEEPSRNIDDIVSRLSTLGMIKQISQLTLPLAYPDVPTLEADVTRAGSREESHFAVNGEIEHLLGVLEKHCSHCGLIANGDFGFTLALPPLQPSVRALVHAKLRRFLTASHGQGGA